MIFVPFHLSLNLFFDLPLDFVPSRSLPLPTSFYSSNYFHFSLPFHFSDDFLCLSLSLYFPLCIFSSFWFPLSFLFSFPFFLCFSRSLFFFLLSFIFFLFLFTLLFSLRSSLFCSSPFSFSFPFLLMLLFTFALSDRIHEAKGIQRVLINWRVMPNISWGELLKTSKHLFFTKIFIEGSINLGIIFYWVNWPVDMIF